jgi:hypothetical protein
LNLLFGSNEYFVQPFHSVAGALFVSILLSQVFEPPQVLAFAGMRGQALVAEPPFGRTMLGIFVALFLGNLLHIFLDMFRGGVGFGSFVLFPFSNENISFELYDYMDAIYIMPVSFVAFVLLEWKSLRVARLAGKNVFR